MQKSQAPGRDPQQLTCLLGIKATDIYLQNPLPTGIATQGFCSMGVYLYGAYRPEAGRVNADVHTAGTGKQAECKVFGGQSIGHGAENRQQLSHSTGDKALSLTAPPRLASSPGYGGPIKTGCTGLGAAAGDRPAPVPPWPPPWAQPGAAHRDHGAPWPPTPPAPRWHPPWSGACGWWRWA